MSVGEDGLCMYDVCVMELRKQGARVGENWEGSWPEEK